MTRYELLERIGAGGMAEIFRGKAVAAGGFEKPVAIKRILPNLSQDKRFVTLLIAEANILAQLRHRNIVQIYDVGLGDDGQYFLVMEYVDGIDLGNLQGKLEQRRKRLPVDLALHIGAEVCEALDHAHRARGPDGQALRLVHRDVSPSNVLLSRSGEVKLTDFGIAKRPEEHTGHGGVRGKFAYISPEQASNLHVDARSDVYSLAIVLYELITGHRLFSALPDFDALRAVREGVVQPPREIDPQIDRRLEELLMKALAHEPEQRFPSAGAFGAELRGFRYALPETGGDPSKEIASILAGVEQPRQRPRGKRREEHTEPEPTVVRIQTAAGFSLTGFGQTPTQSFTDGRLPSFDDFDDAETRALSRPPGGSLGGVTGALAALRMEEEARTTEMSEEDAAWLAGLASRGDTTEPSPPVTAALEPPRIESTGERAPTPTVRDVFGGGLLDQTPAATAAGTGSTPTPAPSASMSRVIPRSRHRAAFLLALAALAVAVASFFIAGRLIPSARDSQAAGTDLDAQPAAADAGVPGEPKELEELEMPPVDVGKPSDEPGKRKPGAADKRKRGSDKVERKRGKDRGEGK